VALQADARLLWAMIEGLPPKVAVEAIRAYLVNLGPAAKSAAPPPTQFAIRLRMDAPAVGAVFETDYFECTRFGRCRMEVRTCLLRQGAKWPGGNRLKDGSVREKRAAIHPYCASGECGQGGDLAKRCTFRPEAVWSKGRYRFFRDDTPDQRKAMKRLDAENLPTERVVLTPFQEVAGITKDDPVGPGVAVDGG
jgi:hypothetical protein